MKDKKILAQELKKAGYTSKEIEKILQWLNDVDKGDVLTAEQVYKRLLDRERVYA